MNLMQSPRSWLAWALTASVTAAVLVLVFAPAYVNEGLRQVIMAGFSFVCHQLPDRSPRIDGIQLAACHRCLGIYSALASAPFAYLALRQWDGILRRHARYVVLAALLVPGVDWMGDVVGVWTNTPASRLATGAVFGLAIGLLLTRAAVELGHAGRPAAAS